MKKSHLMEFLVQTEKLVYSLIIFSPRPPNGKFRTSHLKRAPFNIKGPGLDIRALTRSKTNLQMTTDRLLFKN